MSRQRGHIVELDQGLRSNGAVHLLRKEDLA